MSDCKKTTTANEAASAKSQANALLVYLDLPPKATGGAHHGIFPPKKESILKFGGKYDSELSNEALLQAVGELSFDYTSKFATTDIATFEVIKLKSHRPPQEGLPKLSDTESGKAPKPDYDVQINITSLNRAVDPPVSVTVVAGEIYVKGKEKGSGWRIWSKATRRVPL